MNQQPRILKNLYMADGNWSGEKEDVLGKCTVQYNAAMKKKTSGKQHSLNEAHNTRPDTTTFLSLYPRSMYVFGVTGVLCMKNRGPRYNLCTGSSEFYIKEEISVSGLNSLRGKLDPYLFSPFLHPEKEKIEQHGLRKLWIDFFLSLFKLLTV